MTQSEKNYCQLEKETLAIVFACERFRSYVYGQKFEIYNDHQPLKSIFNKMLTKCPPRVQRFLLHLQQYDFEMHCIKGSQLSIPDTLSRVPLSDTTPEITEPELTCYVHSIMTGVPVSIAKHHQIAAEAQVDSTMQQLVLYVNHGGPQSRHDAHPATRPYFNFRDQITFQEGLLLNGLRIIIPVKLRAEMKKLLHTGHIGIEKTKTRTCETMYWPNINGEIEDMIKSCSTCQEHQNQQSSEPMILHDIPATPWREVATDLFSLWKKDYIIVADYTLKFFDLSQLDDTNASTVVMHTKRIFSKFCIPK